MYKSLSLLFLTTSIFAQNETYTLLTKSLKGERSILDTNSTTIFFGDRYYISSNSVTYDLNETSLNFCDRVEAIKDSNFYLLSDDSNLNLKNKNALFSNLFLYTPKDELWLNAKNASFNKDIYELNGTITSSCSTTSPNWSIQFESGDYNVKDKWVNIYHPKFYVSDVPIFYFPYFGFSTFKERSTGLLRPNFGISTDEGLFYSQPIFIAPALNWDIEFTPQIRINRGIGAYSTFRLIDSKYSYGEFSLGYFKEKDSYRDKFDLKNDEHYGSEFFYERSKFLSEYYNFEDGIYLNGVWLNDIDYMNLKKSINYSASTTNILTSTMNYYIKREDDYYGIYSKYFIDTLKSSNEATLQNLPTLHYHKFSQTLADNFLYSIDLKAKNHYREEGATAKEVELLTPLNFYFNLFDDYLTLKMSENIYLTDINYNFKEYDSGYFFRNYHNIALSTDLLKEYDNFFHSIYLDLSYIVPSIEEKKVEFKDFLPINSEQEENINLKFMQFFYDKNGELVLMHRVNQPLFFDRIYKYGDLENEILYNIDSNFKIYNEISYSHQFNSFVSSLTAFDYEDEINRIILTHLYKDKTLSETNFLSLELSKKMYQNHEIFTKLKYDFNDEFLKSWEAGISMQKHCWDYKISYKEELSPILTAGGIDSIKNRVIYFQINLVPLGGVRQKIHTQSKSSY